MLRITAVTKYKGSTYQIDFENGEPKYINLDIVSQYNLKAGTTLPLSAWEEIEGANEYRKARERALYLIDYKDYSYVDMFKKLSDNYSEDTCYRVMDKLVELGVINDRRYAEGLARRYCEVKGFGRRRAFQEMRLKGLTKEIIDIALEEYDDTLQERLYELVEKKFLRYLDDEKGVTKVKNSLVRYGYSYGDINAVLKRIEEDYESDDE